MALFDKIRVLSPARQIVLGVGGLAILAVVLGSFYIVFMRQPDAVLFSNLRPMDAATIVAELDKKKVPYRLADGGTTVLVAANKVDALRLTILSQDLPLKGSVGFELFNKSDIGLTEFAQKINYQRALQGELARTIMAMDAVDTARVHLSLPEPTIFRDDKRAPRASIALTLKPGERLAPGAVAGIQRLVAAAVSDMNIADVVVVDGEGQVVSADIVAEAPVPSSPAQHAAEVYFADKIRQALYITFPDQDFTVSVAAQIPPGRGLSGEDDGESDEESFLQWTPDLRRFQVRVRVTGVAAREPQAQQAIRAAVAAAMDFNPSLGDEIAIADHGPMQATPGHVAPAAHPDRVQTSEITTAEAGQSKSGSFPWPVLWLAILLIAAIGVVVSISQVLRHSLGMRGAPRQLTAAERQDFAERFQTLLEQGGRDAGRF